MQQSRKRIFVNDVDEYSSYNIAKFLSTSKVEELGEDEDDPFMYSRDDTVFNIVGTVSSSSIKERFLQEQYESPTREELFKYLLECDVVIYNISESSTQQQVKEATWAITALHAEVVNFKFQKMLILVSSVMTWAKTKTQDLNDKEGVLTDRDFKQRKPHPSFRSHNELERLVFKMSKAKKSKLRAYIIAAGIQYGMGENLFHYFFKTSWLMQCKKIPIFGNGTNYIPMIHVHDLGGVIKNIIKIKPKQKYIVAVDDSKHKLEEIIKMISEELGPEKVCKLPVSDAITMKALNQEELDCLSVNLRMDAFVVKVSLSMIWKYKGGILENIDRVVKEFKDTRGLNPIRICLLGPPAVGKTTIAKHLSQHYKIPHITIKGMIEKKIFQLGEVLSETDPEYASEDAKADAKKQLEDINKSVDVNQGRLSEEEVLYILRETLNSKQCRNHGFVLDGFPNTYEQARMYFSMDGTESQSTDPSYAMPEYDKTITPEHVFAFYASDDFLTNRVQGLTEWMAEQIGYTQDDFMKRLNKYRQLNEEDVTVLDFFDQREIHPEHIEVNVDDPLYKDIMGKIIEIVGFPKNYGLDPEEQEKENRKKEEERREKLIAEAKERKCRKEEALAEITAQYAEWQQNWSEVMQQECELLAAQSLPLRSYLMKYVMPSLSEAMLECCKIKPEDPVDFLAEYLLRINRSVSKPLFQH